MQPPAKMIAVSKLATESALYTGQVYQERISRFKLEIYGHICLPPSLEALHSNKRVPNQPAEIFGPHLGLFAYEMRTSQRMLMPAFVRSKRQCRPRTAPLFASPYCGRTRTAFFVWNDWVEPLVACYLRSLISLPGQIMLNRPKHHGHWEPWACVAVEDE